MANTKLRLVHNTQNKVQSSVDREQWNLENAKQLQLFDFDIRSNLALIAINEVSSHYFNRSLKNNTSLLIIDTRLFPDFFSIYGSTSRALETFRTFGAHYIHAPIDWQLFEETKTAWTSRRELAEVLGSALDSSNLGGVSSLLLVQNTEIKQKFKKMFESMPELKTNWEVATR
ncbi:MAG: hypothetical protein QM488_12650 [Rhizobiaceae bacterium]